MGLWQIDAAEEMTVFLESQLSVEKIELAGSVLDYSLLNISRQTHEKNNSYFNHGFTRITRILKRLNYIKSA